MSASTAASPIPSMQQGARQSQENAQGSGVAYQIPVTPQGLVNTVETTPTTIKSGGSPGGIDVINTLGVPGTGSFGGGGGGGGASTNRGGSPTVDTTSPGPHGSVSVNVVGPAVNPNLFSISPTGAVSIAGQTYYGNAYVPQFDMTANQISQQARMQATSLGQIGYSDYGQVSFKGTLAPTQEVQTSAPSFLNPVTSVVLYDPASELAAIGNSAQGNPLNDFRVTSTNLAPSANVPAPVGIGIPGAFVTTGKLLNYYTDPNTGAQVPVYSKPVYYGATLDENGKPILGQRFTRTATPDEIDKFLAEQNTLQKGTNANLLGIPIPQAVGRELQTIQNSLYGMNEYAATPLKKIGLPSDQLLTVYNILSGNPLSALEFNQGTRDFLHGFQKSIISDVEQHPLKQVATVGIGAGAGLAFKGIATGLSALPDFGIGLSTIAPTAFKVGAVGYGALQVGQTALAISTAPSASIAGEEIGIAAKDIALFGAGFSRGEKLFNIGRGYYDIWKEARTLNENIKQGVYPTAPTSRQLELFQKNIHKEFSEKPIMFHTTPSIFYDEGIITPKAGASELPGIYGSTYVSTPFSKIAGSGSSTPSSWDQFVKSFIESLGKEQRPGVAALEPLDFRNVRYGLTSKPTFESQVPVRGKYAYFKEKPIAGVADLPGMKAEIEAIAREGAGSYKTAETATGKKYYTKIAGVPVPVDFFKVDVNTAMKSAEASIKEVYKDFGKTLNELNRRVDIVEKQEAFNPKVESIAKIKSDALVDKKYIEDLSFAQKDIIRQQAEHETNMYEITFGKLSKSMRETFVDRRIDALEKEYRSESASPSQPIFESIKNGVDRVSKELNDEIQRQFNPKEYSLKSLKTGPEIAISSVASGLSSSDISKLSSSIQRDISSSLSSARSSASSLSSSISSSLSSSSSVSSSSGSSSRTSSRSSAASSSSSSSTGSSSTPSSSISASYNSMQKSIATQFNPQKSSKKPSGLGPGYDVYAKQAQTKKFIKLNTAPLTKARAQDVGAYYVRVHTARTFQIKKTNTQAQEDYEFLFVPVGFFKSIEGKLREYKIKNKEIIETPERYVEKISGLLETPAQKAEIQRFRKQAEAILNGK